MLKKFNLKTRMILSICSVALLAFSVTIGFIAIKIHESAKIEAFDKAKQIAHRHSSVIKGELEVAMNAARTTAQLFEGIKNNTDLPQRKQLNWMLKHLIESNPGFVGLSTCWEPNALDGKDSEFANQEGHDSTGRFIPYWSRDSAGNAALEPLVDYDKPGAGDYYLLPLQTGNETIIEPYFYTINGKEILMTSVCSPIKYNNKVVGIVAIDVSLSTLGEMTAKLKPFTTGYTFLTSNKATFVAHPKKGLAGKKMADFGASTDVLRAIRQGSEHNEIKISESTATKSLVFYTPVYVGKTTTPWSFAIVAPMDKILENARNVTNISILIGVISLLILMAIVFFIAKSIADPMLRIINNLNEGANQVSSAASQVSSASQSLAEGSSEQAASLEETSSSVEEMSSMTKQNADNSDQADRLTTETVQAIQTASKSITTLSNSTEEIYAASQETQKIIKNIDEIAFQTNLLALNAAVEAARAGEAGAGFAVVADEVRNLAARSAEAAKSTAELIGSTVDKVSASREFAAQSLSAINEVTEKSGKVGELVSEISAASQEQSNGISQINIAVSEMDKVTQQNAANAEESAAAAEELNAQAEQMRDFVGDLSTMITGAAETSANFSHPRPQISKRAMVSRKKALPQVRAASKATTNPKDIIPFDDDRNSDDFEGF